MPRNFNFNKHHTYTRWLLVNLIIEFVSINESISIFSDSLSNVDKKIIIVFHSHIFVEQCKYNVLPLSLKTSFWQNLFWTSSFWIKYKNVFMVIWNKWIRIRKMKIFSRKKDKIVDSLNFSAYKNRRGSGKMKKY